MSAGVLDAGAALQQRLEQVADDAERGDAGADERGAATVRAGKHQARAKRERQRAEHHPADRPFERLLRTDRRRKRPPAERAAGVVLRRVADRRSRPCISRTASPSRRRTRTAASAPSGSPM